MKIRLSTLLLMTAIGATAIGWACDRHLLMQENQRLNAECAALFGDKVKALPMGVERVRMAMYDATDPEDRQRYREKKPSKFMMSSMDKASP